MCSISGILTVGPTMRNAVARMNRAQQHRGPDDSRIAETGKVILGNTRLAIIDTSSAGHQPMNDSQSGNWITYNGETYNFKDLRDELDHEPWFSFFVSVVVFRVFWFWGF